MAKKNPTATHSVANQVPPLPERDVFGQDIALVDAVNRHAGHDHVERLHQLGTQAGRTYWRDIGLEANRDHPRLHTHDRYGHRIDEVQFHPAWH